MKRIWHTDRSLLHQIQQCPKNDNSAGHSQVWSFVGFATINEKKKKHVLQKNQKTAVMNNNKARKTKECQQPECL